MRGAACLVLTWMVLLPSAPLPLVALEQQGATRSDEGPLPA